MSEKLESVPEESPFSGAEAVSIGTSKQPSSIKSTTKVNSRNQDSCPFDLKLKGNKNGHGRKESKSMLENKQKSSVILSNRNQSTWVIREEPSRVSASSKNGSRRGFLKTIENQEEAESFSEILADHSHTELSQKESGALFVPPNCFREMVATLREIRDISKESLVTKKILVKLLEDRSQISFLYEK